MNSQVKFNFWTMDAFALLLIVVLGAMAYVMQIGPLLSRRQQAQAQAAQLLQKQSELQQSERTLRRLKDQLQAIQSATEQSQLKLEPVSQLNQKLAHLTALAGEHGLQVDTIESGQTADFARYSTVAIRISGRGAYRNCAAFVGRFPASMPDVGVASFRMVCVNPDDDANTTFVFDLLWYTSPRPTQLKEKKS